MKLFGYRIARASDFESDLWRAKTRSQRELLRTLGYQDCALFAPPHDLFVNFMRTTWDKPIRSNLSKFSPDTNLSGLYWRSL